MVLLEIIIALAFVFFLLSTLVSGINEIWAMLLNKRGRELRRAIQLLLTNYRPGVAEAFYNHPFISQLKETPKSDSLRGGALHIINFFRREKFQHSFLPSYIDKSTFSKVLADVLAWGDAEHGMHPGGDVEQLKRLYLLIESLDESSFEMFDAIQPASHLRHPVAHIIWQDYLQNKAKGIPFSETKHRMLKDVQEKIEKETLIPDSEAYFNRIKVASMTKSAAFQAEVPSMLALHSRDFSEWRNHTETLFDEYMQRVSGWYKKRSHTNIFWWSVVIVVLLNVDAVVLTKALYESEHIRAYAVANAAEVIKGDPNIPVKEAWKKFSPLLAFDWPWKHPWSSLVGWLITILAISFGAPFWFDFLNRFGSLRAAGKKPGE